MGRYTTVHRGHGYTRPPTGMNKLHRRGLRAQGLRLQAGHPVDHSMTWSKLLEFHCNERRLFHSVEPIRVGHEKEQGRRLSATKTRPTTSEHGPVRGHH